MMQNTTKEKELATPAMFVAAYLLFQTAENAQSENQPWIRINIRKIHQVCSSRMTGLQYNFDFVLKHYKDDTLWNIYLNICRHSSLRQKIHNFITMQESIKESLDLSTNLVEKIMETKRRKCDACEKPLERRFRWAKQAKGTIGIEYDNKRGPLTTIHYTHACTNKKCKSMYWYDRFRTPKGIVFEDISEHDQMTSTSTFFTANTIEECISFNLDDGTGAPSMVSKYNKRFEEEIDEIQAHLILKNQTLGHRKSPDASLCDKRMLEAVQLRRLLIAIQKDLKLTAFIPEKRIQTYLNEQQKLLKKNCGSSQKVTVKAKEWIDSRCLFDMLYDEYQEKLQQVQPIWLKFAPVKNGQVSWKHFFLQGDGGKKLVRFRCAYPCHLYQEEKKHIKEGMCESTFRSLRCTESPQRGCNTNLVTCPKHSIILHQHGCNVNNIDKFCHYHETFAKMEKNSDPEKKRELEAQINKYTKKQIQNFNKVKDSILQGTIRKTQRNVGKTLANINKSLQYESDEETLTELEKICGEKVVNPFLLNNPKLAEFVEAERQNLSIWNELEGCRGQQQMEKSQKESLFAKTGGLQSWMTHSGFILSLHEHIHVESPTAVILSLLNALSFTAEHQEYAKRVMAVGYDMMCTIYGRLKTLLQEDHLTLESKNLLISLLHCLHVDKFHVGGHKNPLCQKEGNMFNPYSKKFIDLFGEKGCSNDQIVEQNWKITNKLHWAKSSGRRRFNFMLYDIKKRHNLQNWKQLERAGYHFVPIEQVKTIRELSKHVLEVPTTEQLQTQQKFQKIKKVSLRRKRRLSSTSLNNQTETKKQKIANVTKQP